MFYSSESARGYAKRLSRVDDHAPRPRTTSTGATNNFKVAQSILGLILMADFAQGLDASKLILAETVRFPNSCGICSSPQLTLTRTHT
jgi:hypothetical protein